MSCDQSVKNLQELIGGAGGRAMVIVGAGSTLKTCSYKLLKLISDLDAITIGVNNMTSLFVPDFHLWTNSARFKEFGGNISNESVMLFGENVSKGTIRQHYADDFIRIPYTDRGGEKYTYKNGRVYGFFRTAGCLAIMLCHLMKAREIYIAGMDGYTLRNEYDLDQGTLSQHLYGKGKTDNNSWEKCLEKDMLVANVLDGLKKIGISFSIITPTVFCEHYNKDILSS